MTDTLDALVERLRYEFNSHPADTDRKDAADAIEALRAQLDQFAEEFKDTRTEVATLKAQHNKDLLTEAALLAEVEALRKLLKRISEWDQMNPPMTGDHAHWKREIDAAMKGEKP